MTLRVASDTLSQARNSLKDCHYWASCFFAHLAAKGLNGIEAGAYMDWRDVALENGLKSLF